jgi:trans-aconitate 2-methyltransferase
MLDEYLDVKMLCPGGEAGQREGTSAMWDAAQYLRFGGERARPFFDLLAQVGADSPQYVADLGCGPGNLTAVLARRWPGALVAGVDNSPEMIASAIAEHAPRRGVVEGEASPLGQGAKSEHERVCFSLGDVRDWEPDSPPDVLICNAVLQWVPGHQDLLVRWADMLAPGGWLAFQLPGNFDQPSHAIVREMAASPKWREPLRGVELNRQAGSPQEYAELLARPGYEVNAWETSYLHILRGDNPVLEWTRGTTLRPVLSGLDQDMAARFLDEYAERLLQAYNPAPFGTMFPFRRVFTVVHRLTDPSHHEYNNSY